MLYFLICLSVGVAALLLVQKADIECVGTKLPKQRVLARKPEARRRLQALTRFAEP